MARRFLGRLRPLALLLLLALFATTVALPPEPADEPVAEHSEDEVKEALASTLYERYQQLNRLLPLALQSFLNPNASSFVPPAAYAPAAEPPRATPGAGDTLRSENFMWRERAYELNGRAESEVARLQALGQAPLQEDGEMRTARTLVIEIATLRREKPAGEDADARERIAQLLLLNIYVDADGARVEGAEASALWLADYVITQINHHQNLPSEQVLRGAFTWAPPPPAA